MPQASRALHRPPHGVARSTLEQRLRREQSGEVLYGAADRGRYSTDASHYQIEPLGVVVPRTEEDLQAIVELANGAQVPLLARGGGTSQCGQTVGRALVVDVSKHLSELVELDVEGRRAVVQPGLVLDVLNRRLKEHGLMFPVDVSTGSRATLGGMTGNNSCGARSLRYGTMRDNVEAIDVILSSGRRMRLGPLDSGPATGTDERAFVDELLALGRREAGEIDARFPKLQRRVGGYNVDALVGDNGTAPNLAHLLVGSEGTLGLSRRIHLKLAPIPRHKVLGVCHFPSFYEAMDATRHIVALIPSAVELVDRTMIELSQEIPAFRDTVSRFVRGQPEALLLVEFAGDDLEPQLEGLENLARLMADLGFPDSVVKSAEPGFQAAVWEVRKAGLNIMMSMKGDGKPVSFIEDCAVPLEDLAEYTRRLTEIFHKHGTTGTWYAHASVGCLHVRPILNLKLEAGARTMRAIAEEAFAMVREYKGSHSGEHGDGLVRSEFHRSMFGERMTRTFAEVKRHFDPDGILNPGKIVGPPAMDDRSLFRYRPGYELIPLDTALDWSAWGGFGKAVEMCNNNGACRKLAGGVMCPSYRVTRDERHLTRGRANTLRLALSGQLGPEALASEEMLETLALCVGCKGCKRECPTGVDMTAMKTEVLHHRLRRHGLTRRDRLIAYLPRYAPVAARFGGLMNLAQRLPGSGLLMERFFRLSRHRRLPRWRAPGFRPAATSAKNGDRELVLLADTFNRYFEPENLEAAVRVLEAGGYHIHHPRAAGDGERPLCCGRTFLAVGLVDEAKLEARRTLDALEPYLQRKMPVIGLEPSCLFTLKDELKAMLPGPQTERLAAAARTFEEFIAEETAANRLALSFKAVPKRKVLLHGHCHQKAFDVMSSVESALALIPNVEAETVASGCCGMAGAFGYGAETHELSVKMAELELMPAVRASDAGTLVVADGTSCRHQIRDLSGREAVHLAALMAAGLDPVTA